MKRTRVTYTDGSGNPTFLKPKKGGVVTQVDVSQVALEPLMGGTKETKILDLIIPLRDGTVFTGKQVIKAMGLPEKQIKSVIAAMVRDYILFPVGDKEKGAYIVNSHSKRVWAIKNLLLAIYTDAAHYHAVRRLGIDPITKK